YCSSRQSRRSTGGLIPRRCAYASIILCRPAIGRRELLGRGVPPALGGNPPGGVHGGREMLDRSIAKARPPAGQMMQTPLPAGCLVLARCAAAGGLFSVRPRGRSAPAGQGLDRGVRPGAAIEWLLCLALLLHAAPRDDDARSKR